MNKDLILNKMHELEERPRLLFEGDISTGVSIPVKLKMYKPYLVVFHDKDDLEFSPINNITDIIMFHSINMDYSNCEGMELLLELKQNSLDIIKYGEYDGIINLKIYEL